MANSLARIYIHLVWSTWRRTPWIDPPLETAIREAVVAQGERLASPVHAFGAWDDHVHALIELDRKKTLVTVVRALKGASGHDATRLRPDLSFGWQEGYGAFSVSERNPGPVLAYVRDQRAHHASGRLVTAWEPDGLDPDRRG